jgi:hypothetical protein
MAKQKLPLHEVGLKVKELEEEFNKKLVALGKECEKPVRFVTISYVSLDFKGSLHENPVQIKVQPR